MPATLPLESGGDLHGLTLILLFPKPHLLGLAIPGTFS